MRLLPLTMLVWLVGCEDALVTDPVPSEEAAVADTGACSGEWEACTLYEDGTSSCCNLRHTCFPEGCGY